MIYNNKVHGEMRGLAVAGADADQALVSWDPAAVNVSVLGNGTIANRGNSWSTSRVGGHVCPFFHEHNMPTDAADSDSNADGDSSKCRDNSNDCCANQAAGEPAQCADGWLPSNQPQSYDGCPNYTCMPPAGLDPPAGSSAGDPIECEASERQRAALFAPLGVVPMAPERDWKPTRGKMRSLGATGLP